LEGQIKDIEQKQDIKKQEVCIISLVSGIDKTQLFVQLVNIQTAIQQERPQATGQYPSVASPPSLAV